MQAESQLDRNVTHWSICHLNHGHLHWGSLAWFYKKPIQDSVGAVGIAPDLSLGRKCNRGLRMGSEDLWAGATAPGESSFLSATLWRLCIRVTQSYLRGWGSEGQTQPQTPFFAPVTPGLPLVMADPLPCSMCLRCCSHSCPQPAVCCGSAAAGSLWTSSSAYWSWVVKLCLNTENTGSGL